MSQEKILNAIPHRPPMLLIDEIVEQTESSVHCKKTFKADEFFLQGHYPDFPLVPGVILCESAMQAGAILVGTLAHDPDQMPVVAKIKEARFKQIVRPGDTIDVQVEMTDKVSNAFFMSAKVTVDGNLAVRFEFTCMLAAKPAVSETS